MKEHTAGLHVQMYDTLVGKHFMKETTWVTED